MALSQQQVARLNSIIATAKKILALAEKEPASKNLKRFRRSSADAGKMKDQIRAARAKGVPAAKLAEKYGVSTAYIYMIKWALRELRAILPQAEFFANCSIPNGSTTAPEVQGHTRSFT